MVENGTLTDRALICADPKVTQVDCSMRGDQAVGGYLIDGQLLRTDETWLDRYPKIDR